MTEAIKDLPRMRRVLYTSDHRIGTEIATDAGWLAAEDAVWANHLHDLSTVFTPAFEIARYEQLGLSDGATVLPICPTSFRDFMMYEKHAVDAVRGLAKRFVPTGYRVARLYETVTRRTFPSFRPKALWYREPIYYMSNALTIVPSGVPIRTPSYSRALDFELELGVGLGSPLRAIAAAACSTVASSKS